MNWFSKNKIGVIVIILFIISSALIGVTYSTQDFTQPVVSSVNMLAAPIQRIIYNSSLYIYTFYNDILDIGSLRAENELYQEEILTLTEQLKDYELTKTENENLREMLNFQLSSPEYEHISADIVSIDPDTGFSLFTINKGSQDGIEEGMTVVFGDGLVGKIDEVSSTTSKVVSITDQIAIFNGQDTSTGDYIRITGGEDNILIGQVAHDAAVNVGDIVVTSGIAEVYPQGIIVGTIESIEEESGLMEKSLTISSNVDFNSLSMVMVLKEIE